MAALQEAQQDGGPEREEDVHRAVRKQHQPHQPRPRRQLLRAGEHKQAVEHCAAPDAAATLSRDQAEHGGGEGRGLALAVQRTRASHTRGERCI